MNQLPKTALITGAAKRIGKAIALYLHQQGFNVLIHYNQSHEDALNVVKELNAIRANSAALYSLNLEETDRLPELITFTEQTFGRLDLLVNSASSFFPTTIDQIDEAAWTNLMGSNIKAPLFLSKAAAPLLKKTSGSIIGLIDIHAERPLKSHIIYNIAKAAHAQLIRSLAIELAPEIRVNGIAPGCNVWPTDNVFFIDDVKQKIEKSIPLQRIGTPEDLAAAVYMLSELPYVTGQILAVDGGRSLVL